MKVLMFSMDKTLLGATKSGGDAVKRHKIYGEFCDELNVIVFCLSAKALASEGKKGFSKQQLSKNVFVWPTNSLTRFNYFFNAYQIGKQIYKDSPFNLVIGDLFTSVPAWFLKIKFKVHPVKCNAIFPKEKLFHRVKFLMHFHGDFWDNILGLEKKWHNYFILLFSKFLARKADAIRVVSNGTKDKLVKAGIRSDKIFVISTPTDLSKFLSFDQSRVYELKQKYNFENKNKVLIFDGRIEKVKNLNWFLEVFAELKKEYQNLIFLIIGQGTEKENLIKKTKALNLESSVKFLNKVDYEDLTNYYQIADIYILPSLSESFGKVLVQAGASGLPCVASATTGAKEIIPSSTKVTAGRQDEETGLLVPINNKKQFINKILKLLKDEKLAKQMGANAKIFVKENFDGDTQIKKIIKLWQSLVF